MLSKGQQLPASCYRDAQYHEAELEQIYAAGWMAIGFASAFAGLNQSWSVEVLGKPLLITRDEKNGLHVFENVCRHRGHLLQEENTQSGKVLTCPYHAWCYALDGRFINAPFWDGTENSAPDAAQKSTMGLVPVRFNVCYDLILVNLSAAGSGEAESFNDLVAPLQSRWGASRPEEQLRCFSSKRYSLQGNWKLAAENFLDNYHLPWVHPELGSSMEASIGLEVENLKLSENIIGFSHPTAGADKGKTAVPLPAWPGMNELEAQRQDLFFLFPNVCLVMEGYYLWSMILLPTAVDRFDEQIALYVLGDEAMEPLYETSRKQLSDVIYQINQQDVKVIKNLQQGRQSEAASQGVYTPFHDQLGKWFHQAVAQKMTQTSPSTPIATTSPEQP
ncbi:MAG: choline monooxygenase [Gammaproteobacteria bacterium]|jgi:choline monooxygenase